MDIVCRKTLSLLRRPGNMLKSVRFMVIVCSVVLFTGIILSDATYDTILQIEKTVAERKANINHIKWLIVKEAVEENIDKAQLQADSITKDIEVSVNKEYQNNNSRLLLDLSSPHSSTKLSSILSKNIEGKYLNVKNDDNDPFVAMRWGIIADKSLNCSEGKEVRTWEEEIKLHWNNKLAEDAIRRLHNQDNGLKFWEFKSPRNPSHLVITSASWKNLEKVFKKEGMIGIESYEVLVASYVRNDYDILGKPDVNNLGIRQENYKLIVVQGFNISDAMVKHTDKLQYLAYLEQLIDQSATASKREAGMGLLILIPLLSIVFISASLALNSMLTGGICDDRGDKFS